MKIYDISQEVFSCAAYPGDPKPEKKILCATAAGGLYNLTALSMCAHNETPVDAPFHSRRKDRGSDGFIRLCGRLLRCPPYGGCDSIEGGSDSGKSKWYEAAACRFS